MTETSPDPHFPGSFAQARERFLAAARARLARIEHYVHPLPGVDGEELAADVAVLGPEDAADVLLLHSGTHGVEGYCGSGIQHALLASGGPLDRAVDEGLQVVLLHAVNPWGFSWARRVTEDNVDLNRNFLAFDAPAGPDAYDELHPLLLPERWPWPDDNQALIGAWIQRHGLARFQHAVTHGQRSRPDGLFYAGAGPTWSNRVMRDVLRRHVAGRSRLFWIDVHTGLGPAGEGEPIYAGRDDADDLARSRHCWGERVTSVFEGSSHSARVDGQIGNAAYDECPGTAFAGIALEFGTWPLDRMLESLRFDQWVRLHAPDDAYLAGEARRLMRETFFVDTDDWKDGVLTQGLAAFDRVVVHGRA